MSNHKPTRTSGQGRPKGVVNKVTKTLKDQILLALDKVGGVEYLAKMAVENPSTFGALLGRILPMQVTGPNDGPVMIITGVARAGDDETIEHEPMPMPSPRPLPQPSPIAATPRAELADRDREPEANPPPDMRAIGVTRAGTRFREMPPPDPPTHEGRTVLTDAGLRVRTVRAVDD